MQTRRSGLTAAVITVCVFAAPAFAQQPPRERSTPADAIKGIQDVATAGASLSECGEVLSKLKGAQSAAGWWKDIGSGMRVLGYAMQAATVAAHVASGEKEHVFDAKAAQGFAEFVIDQTACNMAGVACPAWMAGRKVGELVSRAPQYLAGTDRSLNDMWTDFLGEAYGMAHERFEVLATKLERLNRAERLALERSRQAEAAAAAASKQYARCEKPEAADPLQAAVDAISGKASVAIGQSVRNANGLTRETERAADVSRTGVAEASRGADQQLQGAVGSISVIPGPTLDAVKSRGNVPQIVIPPGGVTRPTSQVRTPAPSPPAKKGCWRDIPGDCPN